MKNFIISLSLISLIILFFSYTLRTKIVENEEEISYLKVKFDSQKVHFSEENLKLKNLTDKMQNQIVENEKEISDLNVKLDAQRIQISEENLKLKNFRDEIQNQFEEKMNDINNKLNENLKEYKQRNDNESDILKKQLQSIKKDINELNENKIDFEILDEKGKVILESKKEKLIDDQNIKKDLDNTLSKNSVKTKNAKSEDNDYFYNRILKMLKNLFW